MQKSALTFMALMIMLSLGSVLLLSVLSFSHTFDEHGMAMGMSDCPFMSHTETLCPMTVLDHLSMLKSIFEAVLPNIVTLTVIVGVALVTFLFVPKLKPLLRLHTHAFSRWRQRVTYRFTCRLYQDLFARGILNPKLF